MKWFSCLDEALSYLQLFADFEHGVILLAMRDCAEFDEDKASRDSSRWTMGG